MFKKIKIPERITAKKKSTNTFRTVGVTEETNFALSQTDTCHAPNWSLVSVLLKYHRIVELFGLEGT